MTEEELLKKITAVVVEKLGVKPEDVTPDASFVNDLGADSLDRVELVMALEDEFDIEILDEDAEKFIKVSDVLSYIQNKLNK
jgi:acyl carrier protein